MHRRWSIVPVIIAALSASAPAHACRTMAPLDLNDVNYADVVLVGRVSNYGIVRDEEFRRGMLNNPKLPPDMRRLYEGPTVLMGDYARFDVQVEEVLAGVAPERLAATWDNSTFGIPDTMPTGPFLFALRKPSSRIPPLRGPSATVMPSREPNALTVLQAPCSRPFMFESGSREARGVRAILKARR